SRAIELDGGFAEAYRNRGRAQHGQLKHAEAITDLSKALDIDPSYGNAYFDRGVVHFYQLKPDKAVEDLTAAAVNSRDPTLCYVWLGAVHMYMRKPRLAEASLTKAIKLDPWRPDSYLLRGQAYELGGKKQKAERDYNKATEICAGAGEIGHRASQGLKRLRTPGAARLGQPGLSCLEVLLPDRRGWRGTITIKRRPEPM
ncbi:MAG: tetratricopeptide repeat protein, partial [Planctomycetota bacterium]